MIHLDARDDWHAAQRCELFIDGKPARHAFRVMALWNGGPGVVWYYPVNAAGRLYCRPEGDGPATAFRFARRLRLECKDPPGIVRWGRLGSHG